MAGVIDTNILLYAANSGVEEHRAARDFLLDAGSSADRWYLTEGIAYEFLRVATHAKVFPRPLSWVQARDFLDPFLNSDHFGVLTATDRHWTLLSEVLPKLTRPTGSLFFDIRTAVLMREHGVRVIYTTDSDFLQFPDLRVVNPLRD